MTGSPDVLNRITITRNMVAWDGEGRSNKTVDGCVVQVQSTVRSVEGFLNAQILGFVFRFVKIKIHSGSPTTVFTDKEDISSEN